MNQITNLSAPLTEDGEYRFEQSSSVGQPVVVELDGEFDGATVTMGYQGLSGEFRAYRSGTGESASFNAPDYRGMDTPINCHVCLKVENAGANTSILHALAAASR